MLDCRNWHVRASPQPGGRCRLRTTSRGDLTSRPNRQDELHRPPSCTNAFASELEREVDAADSAPRPESGPSSQRIHLVATVFDAIALGWHTCMVVSSLRIAPVHASG